MKLNTLILIRHAAYTSNNGDEDPSLSLVGEKQAYEMGRRIRQELYKLGISSLGVWTSSASRAQGTAEIISDILEKMVSEYKVDEAFWSDSKHPEDYKKVKELINEFQGEALLIVSHLEYVQELPMYYGFGRNHAGYAEGVILDLSSRHKEVLLS